MNYADLKKAAEDRSVWRTMKRDCPLMSRSLMDGRINANTL